MDKLSHDFDYLNNWASLSDADIEKIFSKETATTLQRVVELLGNETQTRKVVKKENFVKTVHEMRKLYEEGSRALGEAILEASDWEESLKGVKSVLLSFYLLTCSDVSATTHRIQRGLLPCHEPGRGAAGYIRPRCASAPVS